MTINTLAEKEGVETTAENQGGSGASVKPKLRGTPDLILPLNGVYFDQIKAGTKVEEYRLNTPYWSKRIRGRWYDRIILTRGYPRADDEARRLVLPWRGYTVQTITHPHFGPDPVEVFAINVGARP